MIQASLASIPVRIESLKRTVRSLLPQVDKLGVYLNGYTGVPKFLRGDPRIDVARSQTHGDRGDAGKFFWAGAEDYDYHLTCDDDLVYPPGWAQTLIAGVERYHRRALVGMHGARLVENPADYHRSVETRFHCLSAVEGEHAVHVLGTGVLAWHRSLAVPPDIFECPNMADLWLARWANARGVPRIVLPHRRGWLRLSASGGPTIWRASSRGEGGAMDTSAEQARVAQETPWQLALPPRTRIVVSVITYARLAALLLLLDDVERERSRFDGEVEVRVYDDASPEYETVRALCAERGYAFTSQPEHRGWEGHWQLVSDELTDLRDVPADWYVFLPDDVRLCEGFFARSIAAWETLDRPVGMNLAHHLSRPGPCWTNVRPREVGAGVEVGWVDGLYLCRRELLERVGFAVDEPSAEWLAKGRGSGTGMALSRKLVASGARLYRVKRSPTYHQGVPSAMHETLRTSEPQDHVDPVQPFRTYPVGRAEVAADPEDHIGRVVASGRYYESDTLAAVAALEPEGLYVDVGAHVGNHTAFFACECGARVLAIEPNAETFARLRTTVEASHVSDRVRTVRAAVHPTWRTGRVVPGPDGNSGMSRVVDGGDSGTVPVVRLDELLWDGRVGLLKVDVEGDALGVLRSGQHVIGRDRPVIFAEAGDQRDAITALLSGLGYRRPVGPYGHTPVWAWVHEDAPRATVTRPAEIPRRRAPVLSLAMMAHPSRSGSVGRILAALDRECTVVWDEKNDRWDTGRRAMLSYDPEATHHAVIQDDVLVCRDLCAGLEKALEYVPADSPVCGYTGKVRPSMEMVHACVEKAQANKASWLTMHTLNWGPLVVVPTACIRDMIRHCDTLRNVPNYDRRLSRYFELQRGIRTWYTWPSLVDHADGPSVVRGRMGTDRSSPKQARVAYRFLGEKASALDMDWSGPVIDSARVHEPDDVVVFRHKGTGQELRLLPTSPRIRRLRGVKVWERVKG